MQKSLTTQFQLACNTNCSKITQNHWFRFQFVTTGNDYKAEAPLDYHMIVVEYKCKAFYIHTFGIIKLYPGMLHK